MADPTTDPNATDPNAPPQPPAFDPTSADITKLLTDGQTALAALAPSQKSVSDAQAQLAADQAALQAAQTNQATALSNVQDLGHKIIQAVTAQYFISPTS